jgi:lipopolysaccharide/colanic/teichoic acid biosynthesis glycosyltransferase
MEKVLSSRLGTHVTTGIVFQNIDALKDEEDFRKILVMERKRTERSNRSFLLLLLDISGLYSAHHSKLIINKLIRILHTTTRETDSKGWYVQNDSIGILFPELDKTYMNVILNRVKASVGRLLDCAQYGQVQVSYYIFPEDQNEEKSTITDMNAVLYESETRNGGIENLSYLYKRGIDILGSIIGMLLFSPLFIIIPILIKCTSRGTVFFKQERVGQYGQKFALIKFRTMKACNDPEIHKKFTRQFIKQSSHHTAIGQKVECKMKDDPRITWIGKFLRKTSLDEIPQFFNVLCGSMSLVGPRPAIPYEIQEYDVWHRRRAFEVKPGITGLWQVKGRSRTDFNNMVRMDIQYITKMSPLMDLQIIIKTPIAIVFAKGAY